MNDNPEYVKTFLGRLAGGEKDMDPHGDPRNYRRYDDRDDMRDEVGDCRRRRGTGDPGRR
jgi:hypothetical protein